MPTSQMKPVIQQLCQAALLRERAALSDAQLLECFIANREEAAFETLVRRHGPMVLGVCRRLLRCSHDVDDAFQATFLVLVRKAACVVPRELLPNWLYGVAYQTAVRARSVTARRHRRERQVTEMVEAQAVPPSPWQELQPLLDQELSRLGDKYRVAVVLCDLEGKTRKAAAQLLGLPEGTLSSRLGRGRTLLARRLARHGRLLSGGSLAALLSERAAAGAVPLSLAVSTVKAASSFAAGKAAAASMVSATAAALTEGVLQAMFLTKLKKAGAVLLVLFAIVLAGGFRQYLAAGHGPTIPPDGVANANRQVDLPKKEAVVQSKEESAGQTTANASQEKKADAQDAKPKDKIHQANAYEIARVFRENAANADKRCLGVTIAVTGRMVRIKRQGEGAVASYLVIMSSSWPGTWGPAPASRDGSKEKVDGTEVPLTFQFDKEARDELALLRPGDTVTIEGQCHGMTEMPAGNETILFRKCKIVQVKKQ
jgi:RNA polymerase sigma factor (sigma-70 family)